MATNTPLTYADDIVPPGPGLSTEERNRIGIGTPGTPPYQEARQAAQTATEFAQQNAEPIRQNINQFVGDATNNIIDPQYRPTNDFTDSGALPTQSSSGGLHDGEWQSLQYAADWNSHHGKFKFLFKVKFGGPWQFYVKAVSRPKIRMNHQDVNYYNFRSKVLTNVTFEPLNIVLHDEIGNSVTNFFSTYVAEVSGQGAGNWGIDKSFDTDDGGSYSSSSSRSYTNAGYGVPILATVIIEQVFANGTRSNRYTFKNVRIESMDLDDLAMEDNGMSTLSMMFNYDAVETETVDHSVIHTDPTVATDLLRGGGAGGNAFGANDDGRQFNPISIGGQGSPFTSGGGGFPDIYSAQNLFQAAIPNINVGLNISPYGVSGGANFGIPGLNAGFGFGPGGGGGGVNINVPGFNAGINVGPNGVSAGAGISLPGVSAGVTMGRTNFAGANIAINPNGVSAAISATRTSSTTSLITSIIPSPGSVVRESTYVSRLAVGAGSVVANAVLVGPFSP